MAELGPELAPEAFGLAEALVVLRTLTLVLYCAGCIYAVHGFVLALFWGIEKGTGWLPFAGRVIGTTSHKIEQRITHYLGVAEQKLDAEIALSWHQLAKLVRMLGREAEGLAHDYLAVVRFLDRLWGPKAIMAVLRAVLHPIQALQRVERAALRRLYGAEAWLRQRVVQGVLPRIGRIEHELDHVVEHDIAKLRARTRTLEQEALREFRWLRSKPWLVVSAAFVGAVAIALRRLGLGWLRCRNVRAAGKAICGLPVGLLEELLTLAFGFLVVVDPVDLGKLAIKSEQLMHDFVVKIAEAND